MLTEFELAENIRDGTIPSPMKFSSMWLVNLRITGTGLAYRAGIDEHVWRDPEIYLNDEFLKRCNGLPVIMNHTDDGRLTEKDFKEKVVGSVMLPYIKGNEVWAVVRIYYEDAVDKILTGKVSTSPSVIFDDESGNIELKIDDSTMLIEGKPFLIDHIALVTADRGSLGVWDIDKIPAGIEITNTGKLDMNEEEMKALLAGMFGEVTKTINTKFDALTTRMDSMESSAQQRIEAEEKEKVRAEKARADAAAEEEKAKADAAEEEAKNKEAEEKAKADAMEAEEEKAKADAAEQEKNVMADEADLTAAQVKADSAYTACGKKAPSPFSGENSLAYRKRVLAGLQKYSEQHKDLNIKVIADAAVLSMVEKEIFADAQASIAREIANKPGQLIQTVRHDDAGRPIKEYKGDMDVWLNSVKYPGQKLVRFNTPGAMNYGAK